ncbi:hypothetical protein ANCDUO_19717, partial [Ancylostoma duodenale]
MRGASKNEVSLRVNQQSKELRKLFEFSRTKACKRCNRCRQSREEHSRTGTAGFRKRAPMMRSNNDFDAPRSQTLKMSSETSATNTPDVEMVSVKGIGSTGAPSSAPQPSEARPFVLKKWNALATWAWDVDCDTCAICRVPLMEECLRCQADSSSTDCVV